jgi:hypothetical protein
MDDRGTTSMEKTGWNRTGVVTAPLLSREMTEGAAAAAPSSEGGPEQILLRRGEYISEGYRRAVPASDPHRRVDRQRRLADAHPPRR